MRVSLYLSDKLVVFKLPTQISGSFAFDADEQEESKLINIEAKNGSWIMYKTSDVSILSGKTFLDTVMLVPNHFYVLEREGKQYLIHVSEVKLPSFFAYTYTPEIHMLIGNDPKANIRYETPYLNNLHIQITYRNGSLFLEKLGKNLVYINKIACKEDTYSIRNGDELEIYGFRILFLKNFIFISNLTNQVFIDSLQAKITGYAYPLSPKPIDAEIKDIDLYNKDSYFSKSPRLRRIIETKEIKLSAPPKDGNSSEVPLLLVIGPMLTMGVMSGTMFVSTLARIGSKETTLGNSWPQLLTSGAMLVSMILWPLITQTYNRRMKKKKKEEINVKYNQYLDEKREELREEVKNQKDILFENLITVEACLNIIQNHGVNFWDKRIDQSDFLVARIGIGNEKLDVKISYPEEGFTIEESDLRKKADTLVEEFKYIQNVPIGYSFYENKMTAVMGSRTKALPFIHNLLLQFITFYSYEDLKIVVFTNEKREEEFEYIRYLNHSFNNERSFRFFATDQESSKLVSDYLYMELSNRMSQLENRKTSLYKPYYLIIVDDYDKVRRHDFVKLITEMDVNLGFSLIIVEDRFSKLPSKCNNFITIGTKSSGVLKNSYENQEQIAFTDEIQYQIDMQGLAKKLSNIPIEFEEGVGSLPDSITFLEMEKVGKVEQLNILNRWNINDSTASLKAEVGVDGQGDLMYLDLHEKYHGPHGLIAGMTGSGKSEFIITYILSMAINYSPDDVAFILIDYKGGGLAFAFENKSLGMVLPHLAGTITNLDKAEMDRTLVSIDSEVKRRQHLFNEARDQLGQSTIDIYKYQKFYKEGKLEEPIPHLFIICDEFAELKSQQPDFMNNLISVARIGRSLGVHLILATQKPSGVVNDQIWSNTKFRVCLKVQDASDSREMLKRPEAASLKQAGRYYLQVGYDEYFALGQSGWCGAKYYPSEKIVKQVDKSVNFINTCGVYIKNIQATNAVHIAAQGEQLSAVMHSIIDVSNMVHKKARKLWLENIPDIILEKDIAEKYKSIDSQKYVIKAIIGEYDAPEKQEQGVVVYNFIEDGNTIIYGNDGAEREKLLGTIIYSSTKNHLADELQYYIIDYGSEALRMYMPLPQIGGMVFISEEEKYNNLFKMIREELLLRKKLFVEYGGEYQNYIQNSSEKLPLKVIIMNNYDSIYESNSSLYEELPDLVRDSERYGIIFIFTGNAINSIHSKISQNCPNIYAFHLKDSSDYTSVFGVRTKIVPRDTFGRGLIKNDGIHEFQTASIVEKEDMLNSFMTDFIKEQKEKNTTRARRIPVLPDIVKEEDVASEITSLNHVPIGINKNDLEIYTVDYLSNLGNIISSNKIVNTEKFVKSLLTVLSRIPNINLMVIDTINSLTQSSSLFPNYYNTKFADVTDKIIEYVKKLIETKSGIKGVILINGLNRFVSKISDKNKITEIFKVLKEYENISVIAVDDAPKIKLFAFESWFTSFFVINEGIWVGRGIADQNLFRMSSIRKEMTKDYKNNMGFVITEGLATLCKLIDFETKEGDENNGK